MFQKQILKTFSEIEKYLPMRGIPLIESNGNVLIYDVMAWISDEEKHCNQENQWRSSYLTKFVLSVNLVLIHVETEKTK